MNGVGKLNRWKDDRHTLLARAAAPFVVSRADGC
jgi:hypothetical protein